MKDVANLLKNSIDNGLFRKFKDLLRKVNAESHLQEKLTHMSALNEKSFNLRLLCNRAELDPYFGIV